MDHWMTMIHGYAFLNVNRQEGPSGVSDFESQNHLMTMAIRSLWGGKVSLLGTFTLEPATIPVQGAPSSSSEGRPTTTCCWWTGSIRTISSSSWARRGRGPSGRTRSVRLYLAPLGEPALGPVSYPHRLSASENPTAPSPTTTRIPRTSPRTS